ARSAVLDGAMTSGVAAVTGPASSGSRRSGWMFTVFGSRYFAPVASVASSGAADEMLTARRPSARRTRTGFRPDFPIVVPGEDLLMRAAGHGLAVGAVLAHSHSVAPPPPGDQEDRLPVRRRGQLLTGRGRDADDERDGEKAEKCAHEGFQASSEGLTGCSFG